MTPIDTTSLKDFYQELDVYERKRIRQRENRMTELEEKIHSYTISFTDKILHFPCISSLPPTIYLDYFMWDFPIGNADKSKATKNTSLFVACQDRTYLDIAMSICEGLSGYEFKQDDYWKLRNLTRKMLYDKISVSKEYQNRYKTWIPGEGYK